MKQLRRNVTGFTLMEINLVLFLFGAGITAMLGVFPVGLRQAQYAFSDTVQVAFAAKVLSNLEANAMQMQNRKTWDEIATFKTAILQGVRVNDDGQNRIVDTTGNPKGVLIEDYLTDGNPIVYCLEFIKLSNDKEQRLPYIYKDGIREPPPRYRAALWVVDSKMGNPKATKPFIADFQYVEQVSEDESSREGM